MISCMSVNLKSLVLIFVFYNSINIKNMKILIVEDNMILRACLNFTV